MLPSRGRPGLALLMTVERELSASDLLRLSTEDTPRQAAPMLQRLRTSHHLAAQHLAAGKTVKETALLVNRTPQSIGDLNRNDPSFQNLVAYYKDQKIDLAIDSTNRMQAKLVEISELAADELIDRLEDPVKIAALPAGELRQLMGEGLDRSIAPRKTAVPVTSAPTHITFNMGTRDLAPKIESGTIEVDHEPANPKPKPE